MDAPLTSMIPEEQKALKKRAAEKAVEEYVKDGMTVGLGSGSTAYFAILAVGGLVREGWKLECVATSERTAEISRECGIGIVDIDDVDRIDVTIDGADEVDPKKNLIKGLGGALLREKVVAAATVSEIIVVDESKLVEDLGMKTPVPVEVARYGHERTAYGLRRQGCEPVLRRKGDNEAFITDNGNYIYDCKFQGISSPFFLQQAIDTVPGVVECGLFLNMAEAVIVARADGTVDEMRRRFSLAPSGTFDRMFFSPQTPNTYAHRRRGRRSNRDNDPCGASPPNRRTRARGNSPRQDWGVGEDKDRPIVRKPYAGYRGDRIGDPDETENP